MAEGIWVAEVGEREEKITLTKALGTEWKLWEKPRFRFFADYLAHFREGVLEEKTLYFTSSLEDRIMGKIRVFGKNDALCW